MYVLLILLAGEGFFKWESRIERRRQKNKNSGIGLLSIFLQILSQLYIESSRSCFVYLIYEVR